MGQRYRVVIDRHYAYFVTCTVIDWLPLFVEDDYRRIILDSLAYLREHKRTQLNAFVVMSTHLHAVIWPEIGVNASDVLRDFKRFTSRSISRIALARQDEHLLTQFGKARQAHRAADSVFQVWQIGSHPEAIYSDDFARQKIEYIHNNPVRAGLVSSPTEWLYSSARAYLAREQTYPATDLMPLW